MDSSHDSSEALKKFQEFSGLNISGKLDKPTEDMMRVPRCGVEDRLERYDVGDYKWRKSEITYHIIKYPSGGLSRQDVDRETAKAFAMWDNVSSLKIRKKDFGPVDIEILFAKGYQGDSTVFEGSDHILAHAYFPGKEKIDGDARMIGVSPLTKELRYSTPSPMSSAIV